MPVQRGKTGLDFFFQGSDGSKHDAQFDDRAAEVLRPSIRLIGGASP
jgi:hypothetical protein